MTFSPLKLATPLALTIVIGSAMTGWAYTWRIDTPDTDNVSGHTSLAISAADLPSIAYQGTTNIDLQYAAWGGSSWTIDTIDSGGTGYSTSLALAMDANGYPHVSYHGFAKEDVMYVRGDGTGPLTWTTPTIVVNTTPLSGSETSMAINGSNDRLHLAYYDVDADELRYVLGTVGATTTTWGSDSLVDSGGLHMSIAVNSSGDPSIAYYDVTNERLKYVAWSGGSWGTPETLDFTAGRSVGRYPSLAFDGSDNPRISYQDFHATNGSSLKYIAWNGTSWNAVLTVESEAGTDRNMGSQSSLAIDADGRPHIAYRGTDTSDLRYAVRIGPTWFIDTVDSSGDTGKDLSMALDSEGFAHISYWDDTNDNLKYANNVPEPGTAVLLGMGLIAVVLRRRRRTR